jgi:hypothetical protein
MRDMSRTETRRAATRVVLLTLILAGCGSSPAASVTESATTPPSPIASSTTAPPSVGIESGVPSSTATTAFVDGPPAARLSAEGGDPVNGQLGTFTWADAGSDSPWLPGAPIPVGAGEPLAVEFAPDIAIATWRARSVPSTASGPDGATELGIGSGTPTFAAPGAGSWTVEIHAAFGDGAGDASYFWRLDVS